MMTKARLRTAYAWDCEDCGRENFERAIIAEFSPEEMSELRQEHGVEEFETGDFVTMPESVACRFCGAEFETEDDRDDLG